MIKPHHILKANTFIQKILGLPIFVARIYGNWFVFQDEFGSHTNRHVFEEISRGYYKVQRLLKSGDVVVDLGAHDGMVAISLARLHPDVKFICVEPDRKNFCNLLYNIRRAKVENVLPLHMGIWGTECQLKSKHDQTNTGGSSTVPVESGGDCPGISWASFRKMFGLNQIALLKMDVEGAEFQIIKNPSDLDGVSEILAEIHGNKGDETQMIRLLETVPTTRLQVYRHDGPPLARQNGQPFQPRNLDAYCKWCKGRMSPWNVDSCPAFHQPRTCLPD